MVKTSITKLLISKQVSFKKKHIDGIKIIFFKKYYCKDSLKNKNLIFNLFFFFLIILY